MTLGVTGVVWLPRTAMVNSTTLLAGAGPAPLATASGAWQSVAAAYSDASITLTRVMAVLAAGWEGAAADAAQARLGAFLAWTQASAVKAADVAAHAAGGAAAYTTATVAMPSPVEIGAVETARIAAYGTGGVLNGSAAAAEATARALDVRAAIVMEAYEAATTPLALTVSFDRPPEIVLDGSGASSRASSSVDGASSYEESSVFGFGPRTSPAQAALAAVTAAVQNPAVAGAIGQVASTAGTVAGSSVTTVASAATNLGGAAVSSLMSTGQGTQQSTAPAHVSPRADSTSPVRTRAVSTGASFSGGISGSGSLGSRLPSGLPGGHAGLLLGMDRNPFGTNTSGPITPGGPADAAAAARGGHAPAPMAGARTDDGDDEHDTPGYLKQFEHFADGRTVAPSVIGADGAWNER
ncbi:PPE domain-containing protein [Rhodococcoides kyotonense]|uniref:PPE-repeat protein n=1 Tax=Rhodococcoides kyotonense TaxID=398843 RepID=A0A239L8N5_9NOCA|nr:PPE domain-containing protein [Rhodococcus kyotonensis]SNT26997.1 PPE-repeat protein [Rhodococcus kyotonensis]